MERTQNSDSNISNVDGPTCSSIQLLTQYYLLCWYGPEGSPSCNKQLGLQMCLLCVLFQMRVRIFVRAWEPSIQTLERIFGQI